MVDNRCSLVLNNQEKICINGKEYLIKEEIGRGASCICYTSTSCENGLNYIIKEFYPLTCAKRTVDRKVVAKDGAADEFLQCKKRFEKLYENNLTIQKTHKNLFVEPNYELSGNGYIIMPARDLCTLSEWVADNIPQDSANNTVIDGYLNNALNILHSIVEQLEIYQKNNIIHFDIKPDNIFVFQENNGYFARIIDFDSMMTFSEIEELLDKNQLLKLYSTANCYGEETRATFYDKLKDGFSEKWKQIDTYPLGKLCTFILTGNKISDIDDFTEDSSFLVSNKSETVNIRKYVFDRFIDKLTAGFGNRYSDAVTVKFVVENLQTFMSCYGYFDNQLKYRKDIVPDLLCNKIVYETKGALSPLENLIKSENIFENKQSLLLVAECGMGKSTALRKLYLDAILFNQSKYRFVYYPLRECGSEKKAKNLEKDVFALSLIDKNNAVVLLDAFDESEGNDGGDCREELTARINAICETNSVILTSRIDVKGLQTAKKVTCKPKDFSDSELLKRIQENSPWVKSLHGDILANPLYVIMAESVSLIDDYARKEKEIGKTCWNLIKEQLIGEIYEDEYGKEQLKINYAGELIYNYYLLRILSQFTDNRDIQNAIIAINSLSKADPAELETYMRNLGSFGDELIKSKESIGIHQIFEFKPSLELFYDYIRNNNGQLYESSWYRRHYIDNGLNRLPQKYAWDIFDSIMVKNISSNFSFLSEIRGCMYDRSTKLSSYQEVNRNCVQVLVDNIKGSNDLPTKERIAKSLLITNLFLGNETLNGINFDGIDLSKIRVFRRLINCSFVNCKLLILKGDFVNCSFKKLQAGSFIHPLIVKDYSYTENGNVLTADKSILVEVSNFDEKSSFAKLTSNTISQIKYVCINGFASPDKVVIPNNAHDKVVIPNNVRAVFAFSGSFSTKELFIGPNTKIINFEINDHNKYGIGTDSLTDIVDNIHCPNNRFYLEKGGCIYLKTISADRMMNRYGDNTSCRFLLWVNKCNAVEFDDSIAFEKYGLFALRFPQNKITRMIKFPKHIFIRQHPSIIFNSKDEMDCRNNFIISLLRGFTSIEEIIDPLDSIKIINDFVLLNNKVIYNLNHNRRLLYAPKQFIDSILKSYTGSNIQYLIVQDDFILRKAQHLEYMLDLLKLFNFRMSKDYYYAGDGTVIPKHRKNEVYEYFIKHIKKIDELPTEDQEDILRQQKEWDKYLNN